MENVWNNVCNTSMYYLTNSLFAALSAGIFPFNLNGTTTKILNPFPIKKESSKTN